MTKRCWSSLMATMMKSQNGAPTPFADNIAVAIDDDQRCFEPNTI